MYLDERHADCRKGVAQGDRGVGQAGRVDQDEGSAIGPGSLYPSDQFVFGIRLETLDTVPAFGCARGQVGIDLGQRGAAVDLRLACAEQIEVRAVQYEDFCHLSRRPAGVRPGQGAQVCASLPALSSTIMPSSPALADNLRKFAALAPEGGANQGLTGAAAAMRPGKPGKTIQHADRRSSHRAR